MTTPEAFQTTLAAEHAAVWVLGVLGARAPLAPDTSLRDTLAAAYDAHRARRDHLERQLRDLEVAPAVSAVAYDLPDGIGSPAGIRAAALSTERACATAYAHLVAHTTGEDRQWAVNALTDAAVRGLVFRGTPENFPGIDELADR